MSWLAFLLPVGFGMLILSYLYLKYGRDAPVRRSEGFSLDPPAEIPPSVLGALLREDGKPREADFLAELLYLSYKRNLDIMEGAVNGNRQIVLMKLRTEGLGEAQKAIFGYLFKESGTIPLSEALRSGKRFRDCIKNWQALALKEARTYQHSHGNFHESGSKKLVKKVRKWSLVAVALTLLCVMAYALLRGPGEAGPRDDIPVSLAAGTILSAISITLLSHHLYKRSGLGSDEYQKWMDFKSSMERYLLLEKKPPSSVVIWDRILVYAVSLGVARGILARMGRASLPKSVVERILGSEMRF